MEPAGHLRRITIGRYHDGSAKPNWGGRATSLAMAGLVAGNPAVSLVAPVNGTFITADFTALKRSRGERRVDAVRALVRSCLGREAQDGVPFGAEETVADRVLRAKHKTRKQTELIALLEGADELWMNGEGDFILTNRPTLFRTLVIMTMADRLGKRVRLLNSILSESPKEAGIPRAVREAVGRCLRRCDTISYRDPMSLELHRRSFPEVPAEWSPDALFGWAVGEQDRRTIAEGMFRAGAEGLPLATQAFFQAKTPYVAVSGSSTHRPIDARVKEAARRLAGELRRRGLATVFVATDGRDDWLATVAAETESPFVPARVPLVTGRAVLGGSRAFVSGRYHPSILAAGLGVPTVYMESNSHKTLSLQQTLQAQAQAEHPFFDPDRMDGLLTDTMNAAEASGETREQISARAAALGERVQRFMRAL